MKNFWKTLKRPIAILAPMEEVTDLVFREIISTTAKPDVFFTEFTSADAIFSKGYDRIIKKLLFTKNQHPIVAQLWGSTPANYEKAAKFIVELGFDGIDINMGCPDRSVMRRNSGAALINDFKLAEEIINAVKKSTPEIPLSVKTRLGSDSKQTKEWLTFLLSQELSALSIHARTAQAMSKGTADWGEIGKTVKLRDSLKLDTLIIGNGDVIDYKDIVLKHKKYGIDGAMVGRGIFQNPWLFDKSENPVNHSKKDYLDLLIKHTRLFNEKWGKTKNFEIMKKFFKVYVKGFKGADDLRQRLMAAKNYIDVERIMHSVEW